MKITRLCLTVLLLLISCSLSFGATEEPPLQPQILNVVLLEIDTNIASKTPKPVVNDWGYWDSQAGQLIARLRREFGHTPKTEKVKTADASLFVIQASAKGLADTRGLAPIVTELDAITMHTGRASLVVVWLRRAGLIYLSLQGTPERSCSVALAELNYLEISLQRIGLLRMAASPYVMPPCVLPAVSRSSTTVQYNIRKLSDTLDMDQCDWILHCLSACEFQMLVGSQLSRAAGPAGTAIMQMAWEAVKANPNPANVNKYIAQLRSASPKVRGQFIYELAQHSNNHPSWTRRFDSNFSRACTWVRPIGATRFTPRFTVLASKGGKGGRGGIRPGEGQRPPGPQGGPSDPPPQPKPEGPKPVGPDFPWPKTGVVWGPAPGNPIPPDPTGGQGLPPGPGFPIPDNRKGDRLRLTQGPGGIMLAPDLEITIDKQGLTSSAVRDALAAVRGDKTAGEITIDGERTLVVRAPGSAKLFQVPVGKFQFQQEDVCIFGKDRRAVSLHRFYDSTNQSTSSLGKGWSLLPYSLRIGHRKQVAGVKGRAARKPVLIDRQSGLELAYRLEKQDDTTKTEPPRYRSMTSSLQPELSLRSGGGYVATFAHGLEVAFDSNGQLQWIGSSESDRVNYIFTGVRLTSITGLAGNITLQYDGNGCLTVASGSNGRRVTYRVVADRLEDVSGSESGTFTFEYGIDNRLAKATTGLNADERNLVFHNTYDTNGRLLTYHTSQEEWEYKYNDLIGRVVVNKTGGTKTEYYYDGNRRLVAYGSCHDDMTLLNYDATGRILQVAIAELINDPSGSQRPIFRVSRLVTPQASKPQDRFYEEG